MSETGGQTLAGVAAPETDETFPALDPARVLADRDGCAALQALAGRLREVGYGAHAGASTATGTVGADPSVRTVVALGLGDAVDAGDAVAVLGNDAVAALDRCGALWRTAGEARLTARVFPMRSVYTLLPATPIGQDTVYLGPDSILLFQRIWAARGYGDRAVDLATGNGFIAAALATRYDHVIAADLSHRCTSTAALVPVLNPHLRSRFAAVQTDVARGLRRRSFDLVTANAPWVPETVGPDGGPPRRFAAGGPTGCELPLRFVDEAAALLVPGGRAFIACLDITFDDGRRPLAAHLPAISAAGFDVTVTASPLNDVFDYRAWAGRKARGAIAARHVIIELDRRG